MPRVELTEESVAYTMKRLGEEFQKRLDEKGNLSLTSTHEVLGILEEEFLELKLAIHANNHEDFESEVLDITVGCIVAVMSKRVEGLDW